MRRLDQLQTFMRSATQGGAVPAHALQLDIANFFNSIHRPALFRLLQHRLARAVRGGTLDATEATTLQSLCRALLQTDPTVGVRRRGVPALFEQVPPHKRLGALGPHTGLPIGNLTSQFFANVYLNELDQFVKHTLKCRHYLRFVDDFVLLHTDADQLLAWRGQIEVFWAQRLALRLKALSEPHPLQQGTDFLGYVVRPHYRLARRRVVQRMQGCLRQFERLHVRTQPAEGQPAGLRALRLPHAVLAQVGHCKTGFKRRALVALWRPRAAAPVQLSLF